MRIIPQTKPTEIIFNKDELSSIDKFSSDGEYTKKVINLLKKHYIGREVFLTSSGSLALDISSYLIGLKPGDEVIVPSYAFTTCATSFVKNNSKIIFADIDQNNMCLDLNDLESKISKKTKAVIVVHYGSYSCDMDKLQKICKEKNILLVEDCAQAIFSSYNNKLLGLFGDIAILSFDDLKNIHCGEGGALIIKNKYKNKTDILLDKGTNRAKFFNKLVNKFTWIDIGFNGKLANLNSYFLYNQLKNYKKIFRPRIKSWTFYYQELNMLDKLGKIKIPKLSKHTKHIAHNFTILLKNKVQRDQLIRHMKSKGIILTSHYEPLHNSKASKKFGFYKKGDCKNSVEVSSSLARLPLWSGISVTEKKLVIRHLKEFFSAC